MSIRRFFLASLALAVLAVGLQGAALRHFSRGAQTIARAVESSDAAREDARAEANSLAHQGEVTAYIGMAVAVASVAFLVVSARRHEPAWRSVTLALLAFYIMLHLTLV
jgi:hypothetical protein